MKIRKTVTEAVLAANRANAKPSTGPRTEQGKAYSNRNAVVHGLLAKKVALETDDERAEFQDLIRSCNAEFGPRGLLEEFLVEEIATALWKPRIAIGLETRELSSRQNLRDRLRGIFDSDIELPIEAGDLPLDGSWDCQRLVIRAVAGQSAGNSGASRGRRVVQGQVVRDFQDSGKHNNRSASHIELEAVLGNSLERITRYQSLLKRDFYRAIDALRVVQKEKREPEG